MSLLLYCFCSYLFPSWPWKWRRRGICANKLGPDGKNRLKIRKELTNITGSHPLHCWNYGLANHHRNWRNHLPENDHRDGREIRLARCEFLIKKLKSKLKFAGLCWNHHWMLLGNRWNVRIDYRQWQDPFPSTTIWEGPKCRLQWLLNPNLFLLTSFIDLKGSCRCISSAYFRLYLTTVDEMLIFLLKRLTVINRETFLFIIYKNA